MNSYLIAQIDFVTIMPFALFGAIAIGMWVLVNTMFNRKTRSESRLEMMKTQAHGKDPKQVASTKEGITKLLEAASPTLGSSLTPKNEKELNKLQSKLSSAGFRGEGATVIFTTLKMFAAITGFFVGGGTAFLANGVNVWSLVYTLIAAGLFLFIPELILSFMASRRKQSVFLGLPDALDLMVVCVEAGLGLDQAMRRVADELARTHPTIATEFKTCNHQLQMGSTREDVLTDLGERNGVEDLKTLASIMIQVDKFGTSVGKALRTQSETMRVRRRQIAEEKAAKTAVKLIFPLVLFIFPGIFVVLVGPAAITMINEMLPALQR